MITTWYLAKNGLWWPVERVNCSCCEAGCPHPPIPSSSSSSSAQCVDIEGFVQDTRLNLHMARIVGLDITVTIAESEAYSLILCPYGSAQFRTLCDDQDVPARLEDAFKRSIAVLKQRGPVELPSIPEAEEGCGDTTDSAAAVTTEGAASATTTTAATPTTTPVSSVVPTTAITLKRSQGVLSWDDYFMSVAFLSALRSKDPSTQVGACIVNADMRIVGIGYNGFPRGCSDDQLPWARTAEDPLDTKYPFVCHAEMNAILNKNSADVNKCKMYVALFPCNECAKMIIQSGIAEVVYCSDKHHHTMSMTASRRLLDMARIPYRQFIPSQKAVNIDFSTVI